MSGVEVPSCPGSAKHSKFTVQTHFDSEDDYGSWIGFCFGDRFLRTTLPPRRNTRTLPHSICDRFDKNKHSCARMETQYQEYAEQCDTVDLDRMKLMTEDLDRQITQRDTGMSDYGVGNEGICVQEMKKIMKTLS